MTQAEKELVLKLFLRFFLGRFCEKEYDKIMKNIRFFPLGGAVMPKKTLGKNFFQLSVTLD
ncbi:MAG TPA: hypothetical protein VF199_07455 [Bacillales bacterium]